MKYTSSPMDWVKPRCMAVWFFSEKSANDLRVPTIRHQHLVQCSARSTVRWAAQCSVAVESVQSKITYVCKDSRNVVDLVQSIYIRNDTLRPQEQQYAHWNPICQTFNETGILCICPYTNSFKSSIILSRHKHTRFLPNCWQFVRANHTKRHAKETRLHDPSLDRFNCQDMSSQFDSQVRTPQRHNLITQIEFKF